MRKVEIEVPVNAPSDCVINALLEPSALRAWWHVERAFVEPKVGGTYAVAWGVTPAGFQYVTTGLITALERNRLLTLDHYTYFHPEREILGAMRLVVEAESNGQGGSILRITQDGYQTGRDWDWYYEAVRQAWPVVGRDIAAYCEAV